MVVLIALLLQTGPDACPPAALATLARAAERRDRAGVADAAPILVEGARTFPQCVPLILAGWASSGWLEARATAARAGAPEVLGPARAAIDRLKSMVTPAWRLRNDYARAALMAAIAAAQDERPEMSLYLTHARSVAERLALVNEPAEWPMPIDELDGELWLEVDRYTDAREAYRRAVAEHPTPAALVGLARASDRLNDARGACVAYRQALDGAEGPLAIEAQEYLRRPECQQ